MVCNIFYDSKTKNKKCLTDSCYFTLYGNFSFPLCYDKITDEKYLQIKNEKYNILKMG